LTYKTAVNTQVNGVIKPTRQKTNIKTNDTAQQYIDT